MPSVCPGEQQLTGEATEIPDLATAFRRADVADVLSLKVTRTHTSGLAFLGFPEPRAVSQHEAMQRESAEMDTVSEVLAFSV